jgi:hypothetical protein
MMRLLRVTHDKNRRDISGRGKKVTASNPNILTVVKESKQCNSYETHDARRIRKIIITFSPFSITNGSS